MILASAIPALALLSEHAASFTPIDTTARVVEILPDDDLVIDDEQEDAGTSYARCSDGHGTLSSLFFSDDDHDIARARAICRPCGFRETCLSGAIEREEPYGVWGGKLVLDGVPVDVKPKRGRPPKHPKPILEVDEVPLPAHLVA
jgi:WhiB family redox-sensing transcriptional regulator